MAADQTPELDFRGVFEATPVACVVMAPDYTIQAANDFYLRVTMTEREAIIGRHVLDVFPPNPDDPEADGVPALQASLQRVSGLRRADAMPILRHDILRPAAAGGGFERRYWRATNSPVLDGQGQLRWIVTHCEDVTDMAVSANADGLQDERRREQRRIRDQLQVANRDLAEQHEENRRLQHERLKLASIVEFSEDAIISKTPDGIITSWNAAAERMFGYVAQEIVGQPIALLFPPELLQEEDDILARLRAGERVAHYETRRRCKDGSDLHVSLSVSPIRDEGGEVVGASKIVRDVSQRKLAEERLAELQAELIHMSRWNTVGVMASSITHDLNQPLAAATNYLGALRRVIAVPNLDQKRAGDIIDKALQQSRRASEIVRHLRSFVAKGEPERKTEDLVAVTQEAMELARFAIKQYGVELRFDAPEGLPAAVIDKVQIQQVLVNLIRNAAEAMADCAQRHVTLRVRHASEAGMLQLDVADSGPGLSEDIMGRLFQPFATTKETGMGLGLSICREIVQSHGGRLWAGANSPAGAVFSLTLPIMESDQVN